MLSLAQFGVPCMADIDGQRSACRRTHKLPHIYSTSQSCIVNVTTLSIHRRPLQQPAHVVACAMAEQYYSSGEEFPVLSPAARAPPLPNGAPLALSLSTVSSVGYPADEVDRHSLRPVWELNSNLASSHNHTSLSQFLWEDEKISATSSTEWQLDGLRPQPLEYYDSSVYLPHSWLPTPHHESLAKTWTPPVLDTPTSLVVPAQATVGDDNESAADTHLSSAPVSSTGVDVVPTSHEDQTSPMGTTQLRRRKSMRDIQIRRRRRQTTIMDALRLCSGQSAETPVRDRISALEVAADRYELPAIYVHRLRRRAQRLFVTAATEQPVAANRPALLASLMESGEYLRIINQAVRDAETTSLSSSSRLYMTSVAMIGARISDSRVIDVNEGFLHGMKLSRSDVVGQLSLELQAVVGAIHGSHVPLQGDRQDHIHWHRNQQEALTQETSTERQMRLLLLGEVETCDVEWAVPDPKSCLRSYVRTLGWLSPPFGSPLDMEPCLHLQVVSTYAPSSHSPAGDVKC